MPRPVPLNSIKALSLLLLYLTLSVLARPDPAPRPSPDPVPALFHQHPPGYANGNSSPERLVAEITAQRRRNGHGEHHGADTSSTTIPRPDGWDDLELLDLVLVQTMDGGLHALERKTGVKLWSRGGFGSDVSGKDNSSSTSVVKMRVRPRESYAHFEATGERIDNEEQPPEPLYILDPHDGQLYVVLPETAEADSQAFTADAEDGTARLQRLPITMEQLIDLSPFTFPQEHSHVFIGSKTTSMRAIDLQTGQDVSSFTPPTGTMKAESTSPASTRYPEACDWDADWGFKNKGVAERFDADGKKVEEECESDIDDRPEDKLFVGQTTYQLSIHSHVHGLIQQLSHTRLVPNSVHRDLAAYWARHGQTKGEVYVRPSRSDGGGAYAAYAAYSRHQDGGKRVGGEYENRWRVEITPDGRLYGFQQDLGVAWSSELGSMGVAVFDVLLPAKPNAYPILLPQPPAYPPALFPSADLALRLSAPSTFVTSCKLPDQSTPDDEAGNLVEPDLQDLVALSSTNYPLINLITSQASEGGLLGRHNISDAVRERLPLLIESGQSKDATAESNTSQRGTDAPLASQEGGNAASDSITRPVERPNRGNMSSERVKDVLGLRQRATGFDWWKWVSVFAVFFMTGTLARVTLKGVRQWKHTKIDADLSLRSAPVNVRVKEPLLDNVHPPIPVLATVINTMDVAATLARTSLPVDGSATSTGVATEVLAQSDQTAPNTVADMPSPGQDSEELPRTTRRKTRRGKRGKGGKRRGAASIDGAESEDGQDDAEGVEGLRMSPRQVKIDMPTETAAVSPPANGDIADAKSSVTAKRPRSTQKKDGLIVSEDVLGYGSQGTVVFKGVFQGRAVAVKRLVADHFSIASQEVSLLQASDDHQNVVRYYYQEQRDKFLYIALELCPASLADIIECPQRHQELASAFNPKKGMFQISAGLKHLHELKIIHRDLKPQNVLVSVSSAGQHRMVLSDFGLAKRLDAGQSSYMQTGNHAVGTTGWLAPECLTGEVDLDQGFEGSSSRHSRYTDDDGPKRLETTKPKHGRLTRAVDLFALGCVYYYVITSGGHPYGGRYDRDRNIIRDEKNLSALDSYGEDGYEAKALISKLLSPDAKQRPEASVCMSHPFFWTPSKRLSFLCESSDRFEIMQLDPPEPTLVTLEKDAFRVVGQNWQKTLDQLFVDNLGKHRKYLVQSVRDLLRAMRNKRNHYQDLPETLKKRVGPLPDGYLNYFTTRFPALFTHVHQVVYESKLRHESQFAPYFSLDESS
ncbi:hypothetical protein QFC22_002749 [Naganishia vaughanmartiniae]|uniref:Uncharacterized protein n=1 Tax=Naganishia vaughanmartiniae TaxID=1424756 RepID=A0ACC2XB49_9TREE|nr:hypothetical protein QFC22_002749 [Naganishia vaughanmartiniae]